MQIVIDIPEEHYRTLQDAMKNHMESLVGKIILNGTPIPDNATNERMVGSWIKSRDSYGTNHFTCPFCEHDIATRNADNWDDNYCSNCGARMVRKENFKKMLQDMVGESMAQDMDEAGKQLARATRGYYMALIDEGFTKAQAQHFTDLFLAGIIGRTG